MRLLVVSQYYWPERFRITDLCAALVERGHQVDVLTGLPNYPAGAFFQGYSATRGPFRENHEGVSIFRAPLMPRGLRSGVRLALNYLSFVAAASLRSLALLGRRYDAIFVFGASPVTSALPAILFGWLTRCPVAHWVQDLWPESASATGYVKSPRTLALIRALSRWIYRQSARVLVQSEAFVAAIERFGLPRSRITYFPNSVEKQFENAPAALPADLAAKLPQGFRLMFAGNIGAAQDFPTLLTAVEALRQGGLEHKLHLVVLGDGSERPWVEAEVKRRGLSTMVHLLGSFPIDMMPAFFAQADALLVSLKREPIFALTIPSKLQSYMACGRPVVGSLDGEGARVIHAAGCGFAGAAENPIELAENILKLYHLPSKERIGLGQRGYSYFQENFDRNRLVANLEQVLQAMAKGE